MNENVQNAIRDFENGWTVRKDPNENFLSQTMTDTGVPLTARQMGGTERMPGEEPEGPSLLESVKEYIGNAPASTGAPLTNAFESMVSGVSNWAKDKPLYRAVMMTDEEKLVDAQKLSGIVGLNAQLLADNPFLYENAKELADKTAKFAFLNGETFSSDNITKLYPEIDLTDSVNAAIALKHAKEVLQARNIIDPPTTITEDIMKAAGESWDTIKKSWEAGNKEFEAGELQYRAMTGELSNEEVEEKLKGIEKTEKEYSRAISNSLIATMVGETVKMGTSMTRMTLKGAEEIIAPLGPSLTMALNQMRPMIPYAATGAAAATGATLATGAAGAIAGAGIAAAGAAAGAIALSKAAVYTGTYRAEAGSAYWDWITRKDANGRNLYTREQALNHARRVGHMNAFIETASLDMALNGISKALGPSAALAVIRSKAAMESLIGAGRGAIAKKAGVYAGKQIAKTATPEILEEGLQQAVGDIDENIFGKSTHSTREIIGNAVDAMIQAVPASVGMALGGAAIAGVGTYRGMRRISKLSNADLKDTVTEFKRENERSLIQNLMKFREGADLYKKSPEAYRKTIQKQLEDNAMGTIYIDVQTAAENEKTHAALNHLVESGTITAQELDTAIKEGKPLELETGKFMQTATPEIHEALADFTTMDRGEKTIHAIREERERYKAMVDFVSMTKEKREAAAAQKILDGHFSEDSEKGREDRATAAELLSGGIDRLQENYKAMLEEAKTLWGDLTGVKTYQDYMSSKEGGVEFTWTKDEDGFDVSKRISNNETWYREFWEKHNRAPTQRELYDLAHENLIAEYGNKTDEETAAGIREMEAAKKRVESIERIGETLKSLEKEDLVAQTLLDPETYEEAYRPLLAQITGAGNEKVIKAARDSALILAKIAENFHKNYGVPLQLATIQVGNAAGVNPNAYGMASFEIRKAGATKVTDLLPRIAKGISPSAIRFTDDNGVIWTGERIQHIKNHLSDEEIQDLSDHLQLIDDYAPSSWQGGKYEGQYSGKTYIVKVTGSKGEYYAALSFAPDGKIWIETAVNNKQASIYKKEIGAFHAEMLTDKAAASDSHQNAPIPLLSLQREMGIVKKETFHEVAAAVMPKNAPKEIKDYLRAQGVTIRLYDPKIAGDRERVTNSAQDKANQYFQNTGKYQGSYDKTTNVIELFDGANESTVIHEGAHMFLSILENMAALDETTLSGYFQGDARKAAASLSKMRADLSAIREWATFSEERLGEYKGTALEKEFTQHAEDIKAGKAGAEERWIQERFARGFEKYLMDGSAPTKETQGVFRRFKRWLTDIYKATKNLGNVTFTPEVKDIFDKMLATEEEINAWAAQRKLEAIDKVVDVNNSEMGNLRAWAESVKEKAHEKAMSYYLQMVKEDAIEDFRKAISSEDQKMEFIKGLGEENEIYQIETIYNSDTFPTAKDKKEFLSMSGHTEETFREKLKEAGGTTEERWNAHIEDMLTHYKEEALTPDMVKQMAEDILNSPEGLQKKSRIEAMLLESKVTQYINLVTSMQLELKRSKDKTKTAREIRKRLGLVSEKETTELDKQSGVIARSQEKISKLEKQVESLKDRLAKAKEEGAKAKEEGAETKETASILEGNLRAIEAELERERRSHEKDNETQKDTEETIATLSTQLKDMVQGLRESRKAMKIDLALIKEDARNTLGGESLSHATSWRWWLNKAQIEEGRAMQAAAKNDWDGAVYHKQAQAQCLIMAKEARKNEDEIRTTLHGGGGKVTTALLNENGMEKYGILGILNRISRTDKPVMMKDDARYFVQHMAYVLGMTKKDGILPIDDKGQERQFNWHWLAVEMNPMQAMENPNYMAEDIIPSWMRQAFDGNEPKKLSDLTMDQFREMAKTMKAVYKLGRREYEGNTLGTSFDNATKEITDEIYDHWTHRTVIPQIKAQTDTAIDRVKAKAHSLVKDITLPEVLIERMGEKAYKYFYMPIDKATAHLREMKQSARNTFRHNFDMYSRKEWTEMRGKKLYAYGIDDRGNPMQWTKEQLIAMALNFGTKSNRQRLIETLWGNEADLLDFLDKNLTSKDWDFVESVWNHLNSYWGERNKVQNDLYGTPLGKVKGENFTLKSGRIIHGQYYRIKYDPTTSSKTGRNQANDIAKMDMENTSAFSLGMGSTKQRAAMSGGQKLRLDLDVYVESVNEAMQHIAMREATVDVYKLLTRKEIVQAFELTTGPETIRMLQEWAKDNWHSSIKEMAEWDSMLGRARRRFNFTTMGFRLSTALLNIGNITGMMDRMGSMNALKACWDFYKNPADIAERMRFIQSKSSMMNDRRATIDRDMYLQDRIPVGRNESELRSFIEHGKYGVDALNKNAYWFIQFTDGVFSYPEWLHTYRTTLVELEAEGKLSREEMDAEAVRRADKMVRETFGSNEIKDQTQFSRDNGILAQMTSFFSYTNLVTNQFIRAGYILYDKGDVRPLLAATWYWWVLGAAIETAIRAAADDSDDKDKWEKKAIHVFASNGPFGGVPLLREIIPWTVDFFVGKKPFGSAAPDAPAFDMVKHTENFLKAMEKEDYIEAGRGITKAITRSSIPIPDTIVDAFWNFMRLTCTDNTYTVQQFIWKSLWDKSMKKGGEKK